MESLVCNTLDEFHSQVVYFKKNCNTVFKGLTANITSINSINDPVVSTDGLFRTKEILDTNYIIYVEGRGTIYYEDNTFNEVMFSIKIVLSNLPSLIFSLLESYLQSPIFYVDSLEKSLVGLNYRVIH